MKKNALLSMTILSAVLAAGITPLTSYAAQAGNVQCLKGNGYQVYIGRGTESLSQILKGLCPAPDLSEPPITEVPDADTSEDTAGLSYAEQIVKLVNEERAKAGLLALTMDTDITAAANVRAKEIKQTFSHTRPDGSSFSTVLRENGVNHWVQLFTY